MKTIKIKSVFFALMLSAVLTAIFSGCDENGGITIPSGATELSLNIKEDGTADSPVDEVIITEAKALITDLQYERESGRNQLHHSGPFIINFVLSGALKELYNGYIVRDKYTKVKFQLHKPSEGENVADTEFKEGTADNQRFSFIIKGTYNGNAFIYKSKPSSDIVINMNAVSNINLKKQNITVVMNKSGWFKNGSTVLNPNDVNNAAAIDANIKNSFRNAFIDNNKDGQPD